MVGKVKFEARIRELVENLPDLAVLVEPMLIVRRVLREQIVILHVETGGQCAEIGNFRPLMRVWLR